MPRGIYKRKPRVNTCHPDRAYHCKGLCKECYQKSYRERTADRVKEWHKEYYRNHKEDFKANREKNLAFEIRRVLSKLGWTPEEYTLAEEKQKGLCAICGGKSTRKTKDPEGARLDADHDHITGEPRELLCNACNVMLGNAKDSPTLLEKAAAYLRKWGKT